MLTRKLHIKSVSDVSFIIKKQQSYSYAFRKLFCNIDKISDKEYLSFISNEFGLSQIELRSLISEVNSKYAKVLTNKKQMETKIVSIEKELVLLRKKTNPTAKTTQAIFKLNKKLQYCKKSLDLGIVFGGKALLREISFLSNEKENNKDKISEKKSEFINKRLLPIYILGEANQKGNRFLSFDLPNNKITYRPCRGTKIELEFSNYKSYKKDWQKLQYLIDNKLISISVMLSGENICLSFNDKVLHGYSLDVSSRTKEIKKIKEQNLPLEEQTQQIKTLYKECFRRAEKKAIGNKKPNRYLAIDTNPDYIGCSILDKCGDEIKVVHAFNYDLTKANERLDRSCPPNLRKHINNKRIHGISHLWKDLFKILSYYQCAYIVLENLELGDKKFDIKESNRKTKNLWHRSLSAKLIDKYCNKNGVIKIEIEPQYTSFIGNIEHQFIDPVNASIEIGRRGMFKYKKEKFFPEFNVDTIVNAMSRLNKSRDVSYLKDCTNWKEMYRNVQKSGLRYRAAMDDASHPSKVVGNLIHVNIAKILFSLENFVSLLINT